MEMKSEKVWGSGGMEDRLTHFNFVLRHASKCSSCLSKKERGEGVQLCVNQSAAEGTLTFPMPRPGNRGFQWRWIPIHTFSPSSGCKEDFAKDGGVLWGDEGGNPTSSGLSVQ